MIQLQRAYNFGAGPAMLPTEVLLKIQSEMLDWQGTGVSIMEIGHRTDIFQNLLNHLQLKLRSLMQIPDNYKIVLAHGGAQGQFSAIPMNLLKHKQDVDYMISGIWSKKAALIAKTYAKVNVVFEASAHSIPNKSTWCLDPEAAYVYYCPNESIDGLKFVEIPNTGKVPLISDMTSCILSTALDVNQFGLIFASAQKNLGIAGVSIIIVRDDLLDQALDITPSIWNYKFLVEANSGINTPAIFPIYVMDLMVDWMIEQGGMEKISYLNQLKSAKLYNYIDNSDFYFNQVDAAYRSIINIPFNLHKDCLVDKFLAEASVAGLKYLKGHILVGGCRASLYNAMPESGVDALIDFMREFASHN